MLEYEIVKRTNVRNQVVSFLDLLYKEKLIQIDGEVLNLYLY